MTATTIKERGDIRYERFTSICADRQPAGIGSADPFAARIFFVTLNASDVGSTDYVRDIGLPVLIWLVFVALTGYLAYVFRKRRDSNAYRACFYLNALSCVLFIGVALSFVMHVKVL